MDLVSISLWLLLWFFGMGIPNFLFKKGFTTYYQQPVRNSVWFLTLASVAALIFKDEFAAYFSGVQSLEIILFGLVMGIWLTTHFLYRRTGVEYYKRSERWGYQITKAF